MSNNFINIAIKRKVSIESLLLFIKFDKNLDNDSEFFSSTKLGYANVMLEKYEEFIVSYYEEGDFIRYIEDFKDGSFYVVVYSGEYGRIFIDKLFDHLSETQKGYCIVMEDVSNKPYEIEEFNFLWKQKNFFWV